MVEYDPTDLIALCASILDDGEVTSDEAYQLADWLNNHPDAAQNWPGKDLVKPLQEIWADGSVNRRELHRLARLLISIQREWARRPKTKITSITADPIPEFSETSIDDVRLPSLRGKFRVPSQSEAGRFYEVDLSGPSCSCPDWCTWRSGLPTGDFTRCCKHVLSVYATPPRRGRSDGWLLAFIENGWPAHPGAEWHLLNLGSDKVLFCTASEMGWANVFAKQGRGYARFGFNVDEYRWAYGTEPQGAAAIANAIAQCKPGRRKRIEAASIDSDAKDHHFRIPAAALIAAVIIIFAVGRAIKTPSKSEERFGSSPVAIEKRTTPPPAVERRVVEQPTPQTLKTVPSIVQREVWRIRTIRVVRAKTNRGDVLIPKGTELRVVGRARDDVMISYRGATLTIPAGSTDLK